MRRIAVIGIGNPGPEYAGTFHNVGMLFAEWLAARHDGAWNRKDRPRHAILHGWHGIAVGQTGTFMNESGGDVRRLADFLKAEELAVAHDDTDLALGEVKLVRGGGAAGHKGVRSVYGVAAADKLWRLKIGARPERFAGPPHIKAENFVLNRMSDAERDLLYGVSFPAAEALIEKDIVNAMPSGPDRSSAMGSDTPESS